jgi:hypothetical protein
LSVPRSSKIGRVRPGGDAAKGGVERQLSDRNAHPAKTLIAQSENALAIGHHDHVHVAPRSVARDLTDAITIREGNEQTPRAAIDFAELLAGQTDGRRIYDRQHLLDVLTDQPVEDRLIRVLQRPQIDMPSQISWLAAELGVGPGDLLVDIADRGRQQPAQSELGTLRLTERYALIDQRIVQPRQRRTLWILHDALLRPTSHLEASSGSQL